ncbi:hypothetical protein HanPSC8_Chr02g0075431 [Helianthus annuus]|nr:hypothetical protein HanPSC8_Chr02g0075431 [Helianthus annuus]
MFTSIQCSPFKQTKHKSTKQNPIYDINRQRISRIDNLQPRIFKKRKTRNSKISMKNINRIIRSIRNPTIFFILTVQYKLNKLFFIDPMNPIDHYQTR